MRISTRLGLVAGALLYAPVVAARAQVVPPPPSAVPIPVKPKTDSGPDSAKIKTDTIKAPIGRFADPALYEIGPQYEWNRADLFATGSLSVADLLDRIPGVTTFRSGWLATPQTATYSGDFRRIRIFYDGIEIDNLDSKPGGVLDLSYTRADVATGNEDTNLYRGFYGKRQDNGGVLQFAGQQYGVTSPRFAGSGDALSLLGRIGVAKKSWSIDAFVLRHHPTRAIERPLATSLRPPVLALDATYTDAYVRAAVGGVNSGPWASVTVASLGYKGTTSPDRSIGAVLPSDTLERRASEAQYNVNGGVTLGALRVEVGDRLRALAGTSYNSASARADVVSPFATLSGFIEHDAFRKATNADVGLRAQPLPFLAVSGSFTQSTPSSGGASSVGSTASMRGEAAIKFFGPWVSFGLIRSERTAGLAPVVYDTLLLPTQAGRIAARTASIRGPLISGLGIDAWLVQWNHTGPYIPKYQGRAEINYANNFAKHFPRGDFAIKAAGVFEYRSHVDFPLSDGDVRTEVSKTLSGILEIRILRAVISYQQRNLLSYQYQVVPGFEMPRVLAIYGVRWEFWN